MKVSSEPVDTSGSLYVLLLLLAIPIFSDVEFGAVVSGVVAVGAMVGHLLQCMNLEESIYFC